MPTAPCFANTTTICRHGGSDWSCERDVICKGEGMAVALTNRTCLPPAVVVSGSVASCMRAVGRPRLFGSARGEEGKVDSPPHTSPYSLPPFLSPSFLVHLRHLYIFVIPSSDGPGPSILSFHILHTHPHYSLSLLHCVQGFLAPVIDYTLLANVFALFRLSSGKRRRR